ncbi:MAG: ATP-binding cassette domain-containing protein [Phyllobacterium sp.]|uniref:ATP-binding cassette domain-containing protein n=1 Tax=Phyllobacterium sp. TaxID=1871046 RepID=UPI0030F074BB
MAGTSFSLEGIGFEVDGRALLQPLTLDVPSGEVVGILGHNGSGKSTLLKIMARFQLPTAGRIEFAGKDLASFRTKDYSRRVAYLPQQTPDTDGMTVREVVALGRYPWHGALGRFSATDRLKVADALALTSMTEMADRVVDTLSGGERQRAFIAMLIAQDTECLLLDEPISALDISHQIEVMELIRMLAHEHNKTVLIVLHDINMAARYCDRLIALAGGRLVAHDETEALITADRLDAIYGVRMGIFPHPQTQAPISYVL